MPKDKAGKDVMAKMTSDTKVKATPALKVQKKETARTKWKPQPQHAVPGTITRSTPT